MTDVCCLQEVWWRGLCARMLEIYGRRFKLWCSGKRDGLVDVGVMVKEELCRKGK